MRSAMARPAFRWVYFGTTASSVGSWMQTFVLAAMAERLTHSAVYVGLVMLAQLGPTLLLSPLAGVIADARDRRRTFVAGTAVQAGFSALLALVALSPNPSQVSILTVSAAIGVAGALVGPAGGALIPHLVTPADIPAAIALYSAQMNLSRVAGPMIVGTLIGIDRPALVFAINGLTYLFVIAAFLAVRFDVAPPDPSGESAMQRFASGLRAASTDPVVRSILQTISLFSLLCLVFIFHLQAFVLGLGGGTPQSYTVVFSSFGLGAAAGSAIAGRAAERMDRTRLTQLALVGFGCCLGALAMQRTAAGAALAAFATGGWYFVVVTTLSIALHVAVDDGVRGRISSLWIMGWVGLVPIGSLVGGVLIDRTGPRPVFAAGAAAAVWLSIRLRERPVTRQPAPQERWA